VQLLGKDWIVIAKQDVDQLYHLYLRWAGNGDRTPTMIIK